MRVASMPLRQKRGGKACIQGGGPVPGSQVPSAHLPETPGDVGLGFQEGPAPPVGATDTCMPACPELTHTMARGQRSGTPSYPVSIFAFLLL